MKSQIKNDLHKSVESHDQNEVFESRELCKLNISDYDIVVGSPSVGKTVFAEVLPKDVCVIDTDVIYHWLCMSWTNIKQLRRISNLEWAKQLDIALDRTVHNMAVLIFHQLKQKGFNKRPILLTNIFNYKWADKRIVYVCSTPERYVQVYNAREKKKRRNPSRPRIPSPYKTINEAKVKTDQFMKIARKFNCPLVQLPVGSYLSDLFGETIEPDFLNRNGMRQYSDLSSALQFLTSELDLSLELPDWISRHASGVN